MKRKQRTGDTTPGTLSKTTGPPEPIRNRHTDPPLTSVVQDIARLGSTAFALLEQVIAGGSPPSVRLPTSLVVRRSTRLRAPAGLHDSRVTAPRTGR